MDGGRSGQRRDAAALCGEGLRLLRQGDPASAVESLGRVVRVLMPGGTSTARGRDEALREAVRGLGLCLEALKEARPRQRALEALFAAFQGTVGHEGGELREELLFVMLSHTSPEERRQLAAWARRDLPAADSSAAGDYWRLLLDLEVVDPGSSRALLDECRAAGFADLVAEKLLDLDRIGEALILARRELGDAERLLRFVSSPGARAQAPAVMALVEERLARGFDCRLAEWLAERYAERGDLPRATRIRERLAAARRGEGSGLAGRLWGRIRRALGR